jgi:CrcB protein
MTVVMVLLGGAVGAPLRYLTDLFVQSRIDSVFPWGTFIVNIVGSFALGIAAALVTELALPTWVLTLVGTGFCGALTTFSSFGFETIRLLEEGSLLTAVINCAASLIVGLAACTGGFAATTALL